MRQPSSKLGTHLPKPVVSSRRDAKFCVSSRRDAIFWAGPEFPRKMRARNILLQILTFFDQKSQKNDKNSSIWHAVFPGYAFLPEKKKKMFFSEAHGVVRVRLLPWPSCLPDEQNHGPSRQDLPDMALQNGLQAGTWTFQKHGLVTDSDPHGSKSGSEGIPWQLFSRWISWQGQNSTKM